MQFGTETVCTMTKNIRTILMPLLIVSYIFGFRIVTLSSHAKLWFNILYMMLIWMIYYFFATCEVMSFFENLGHIEDNICFRLEIFLTILSIIFDVYYDKVRKCI